MNRIGRNWPGWECHPETGCCHLISCNLLRRSSASMFNRTETSLSHGNNQKPPTGFVEVVTLYRQFTQAMVPDVENTKSSTDERRYDGN